MALSITKNEKNYPPLLNQIPDKPEKLYCLGQALGNEDLYFAIVGTRRVTPYGRKAAHDFAYEIARSGFVVVSGLAYGIDAVAHEAALEAGGKTVAVLGSGLDHIGPPSNIPLAERIKKNGTIVTEYEHTVVPTKWTFPQRNRIIAGMSVATLVIEAPEKSGALITAGLALDYNRDIFAVPGNIDREPSRGTNVLIQRGEAHLVTKASDIFDYFEAKGKIGRPYVQTPLPLNDNDEGHSLQKTEQTIYALLKTESMTFDSIVLETHLPISEVIATLSVLELKGLVKIEGSYALITR